MKYSRTISPHFISTTSLGYIRSTPFFPATQSYAAGHWFRRRTVSGLQLRRRFDFRIVRQSLSVQAGHGTCTASHAFKWGVEIRVNRDSTIFGTNPNGVYKFGGGTAYSPVLIPSASGTARHPAGRSVARLAHRTADCDALFLQHHGARPASLRWATSSMKPRVRREAYNFYFQDAWKATSRLTRQLWIAVRDEQPHSRSEEAHLTSPSSSERTASRLRTAIPRRHSRFSCTIRSRRMTRTGTAGDRGSRSITHRPTHTVLHAGGAITTLLPNLWQDNFLTGGIPFVFQPFVTRAAGRAGSLSEHIRAGDASRRPTHCRGNFSFPTGTVASVPPNTQIDLQRFQNDLDCADARPSGAVAFDRRHRQEFSQRLHRHVALRESITISAISSSVPLTSATAGIHLASGLFPNSYGGADPAFAPFTQFNSAGQAIGGYGPERIITSGSHSSYHALQTSVTQELRARRAGPAGELHVFKVSRRHQRRAGRAFGAYRA